MKTTPASTSWLALIAVLSLITACLGDEQGYGTSCNSEKVCGSKFSCTEGKCGCHFPDHQFYNSSSKQCISYAQGPCHETINNVSQNYTCIENSACSNATGLLECLCKPGYSESTNRTCKIAHGEVCTGSGECDTGLNCVRGKCNCPDFYEYSDGVCRGLVGARCDYSHNRGCYPWARCIRSQDGGYYSDPFGICRCSEGRRVITGRRCSPKKKGAESMVYSGYSVRKFNSKLEEAEK